VEKVKQRWEWKEAEAALRVWNDAVLEARAVAAAALAAARGAEGGALNGGDTVVVDALELWREGAGLEAKVAAARQAVVKEAGTP
jgi:hypothetical protein